MDGYHRLSSERPHELRGMDVSNHVARKNRCACTCDWLFVLCDAGG